jgi:hypothetical protein
MPKATIVGTIAGAWSVRCLSLLPIAAMTIEVMRAPKLQLADYWPVLIRISTPTGDFNPRGLWALQNEHFLLLPSLLYWLDANAFGGDNRVLGVFVIVIAALTVVALSFALPQHLPPLVRAGLTFAASALIFNLHGLHNFAIAMSGTAWLLANLFTVTALLSASGGRWWTAWTLALLASVSYGTGFPVWIALAFIAVRRKDPLRKLLIPLGLFALVLASWVSLRPTVQRGGVGTDDIGTLAYRFFSIVGQLWTAEDAGIAVIVGVAVIAAFACLLTVRETWQQPLIFWWALAGHALMCCAMISFARLDFGADQGLSSRYASLSALSCLPLLVIVATITFRWGANRVLIATIAVGLLGFVLGSPKANSVRSALRETDVQAVAMRVGIADPLGYRLPAADKLNPRLQAMAHYPFSDKFSMGCGGPELGSRLELAAAPQLPTPPAATAQDLGWIDSRQIAGEAITVRGWVSGGGMVPRCALLVSAEGIVIGGGMVGQARLDVRKIFPWAGSHTGFVVVGRHEPGARLVFVFLDGRMLSTPVALNGSARNS